MIAKYTASGKRLWLRSFSGQYGAASPTGLAVNARGDAYVTGIELSADGIEWQIFVLKFSSRTGKRVWVTHYSGKLQTGSESAKDVALGPNGAVYVTGSTATVNHGPDALLLNYVDKGRRASRAWVRTYRNPANPPLKNTDVGKCVVVDRGGRVFWAGSSDQGTGKSTVFVRRVKVARGGAIWTDRVASGPNVNLDLSDLAAFPSGGVVSASILRGDGATGYDSVVTRYTARGAKRFTVTIATVDDERVNDLAVDGAGHIAIAGSLTDGVKQSAWIVRGSALFTGRWQRTFDSPQAGERAFFNALTFGANGALYCAGRSGTGFITGADFTMVKYSATGAQRWVDVYDDLDSNRTDECYALLHVGGSKPGLYGAGYGGATTLNEALLIKYRREQGAGCSVPRIPFAAVLHGAY